MSVFIIAEAGVNHNGDIEKAIGLINVAKSAGADAVKFQTFKASKLVTGNADKAKYQINNTGTYESQYKMLKKLEMSPDDFGILSKHCTEIGISFLSTPFDFESVDLLSSLNVPLFKVSSSDLTNLPLLRYIARIGKPVILSTGMSTIGEIDEAINTIYNEGNNNVSILHCTTNYPTPECEVNLRVIDTLRNTFKVDVGYSDHTEGIYIAIAAVAMGAVIIEKHFTLDRQLPGPDHKASLEPEELKLMIQGIRSVEKALGNGIKKITSSEAAIMQTVRKSLVAGNYIQKGSIIKRCDLDIKRPERGILPKYIDDVTGKIARRNISPDEHINWVDIE